jgi:hypothetical protein
MKQTENSGQNIVDENVVVSMVTLLISTSHGLGQTVLSQINPYFFNVSYRPA